MILLTGSTGNTGSLVAEMLTRHGVPFKCLVRRPEAEGRLKRLDYDVVYGDFDKPETLVAALAGISKVYLVCTPDERIVEREGNLIEAAKSAGVHHIVKLSALLASESGATPNLTFHGKIESMLIRSDITYTIIRPHGFMQTLYFMNRELIEGQRVMGFPAGDSRSSHVDIRNVAEAVYSALTKPGHENRIYNVTGPESLTFVEMTKILSDALGFEIRYLDIPEEQIMDSLRSKGVPECSVQHVVGIGRLMRNDELSFVTGDLEKLGVAPRTFSQFAADLARGNTGAATSFHS